MIEPTNVKITHSWTFNSTGEDSDSNTLKSCADGLSGESGIPGRYVLRYNFIIPVTVKHALFRLQYKKFLNNFIATRFDHTKYHLKNAK